MKERKENKIQPERVSGKKPKPGTDKYYLSKAIEPLEILRVSIYDVFDGLFPPDEYEIGPDVDIFESDGVLIAEAAIPGVDVDDITLVVESRNITISGEVLASEDYDEDSLWLEERYYGPFKRSVRLPMSVNPENTTAYYHDGILRVDMPIDDTVSYSPKEIEVDRL